MSSDSASILGLWDSVIATLFIVSGIFGLIIFFATKRKKTETFLNEKTICITNSLTLQPVASCDVVFLKDGQVVSKLKTSKRGHIAIPNYESIDQLHITAQGYLSQRKSGSKVGNEIKLVPHLPHWQRRSLYGLLYVLSIGEIVLLVLGTLLIPFFASNETLLIFFLAALSLWLLLLKRVSRPHLKLRVLDAQTGQPINHALVAMHHDNHTIQIITNNHGRCAIVLPLPGKISIICSGYYPVEAESLPASAISEDEIYIPIQPLS